MKFSEKYHTMFNFFKYASINATNPHIEASKLTSTLNKCFGGFVALRCLKFNKSENIVI
jgi:hypothetical protein